VPFRRCMDCPGGNLVDLKDWVEHKKVHRYAKSKAGHWSSYRHRSAQRRFRNQVLGRDGYRCTRVLGSGLRCSRTDDLFAHHLKPLAAGGTDDLANGVTLCREHHMEVDSYAR
jgi:HNH endonuclease